MINFWSIVRLTITSAIRSHVFQVMLCLLLLLVFIIPNTISGDGTAHGFIRISLKYNLAIVSFVLTISTVWLSCFTMNNDLEGHQLHLIFTKSIPRWKVWLGKCCGVLLLHVKMLFAAAALIYTFVQWQYENRDFSDIERQRVENEVLVGRRTYYPQIVDIEEVIEDEQQRKLKSLQLNMGTQADVMARSMERSTRKKVIKNLSRVKFGPKASREWVISGLPVGEHERYYLRYRTYVGNLFDSTGKQRGTAGLWSAQVSIPDGEDSNGETIYKSVYRSVSPRPQPLIAGVFNEVSLPGVIVDQNGIARLRYTNFDFERKDQFFQPKDGPLLMVKVTSFHNNYFRCILVFVVWLAFVAVLSCCAATFASLFSALFLATSYFMIGSLATYVLDVSDSVIGSVLSFVAVKLELFDIAELVADGRLVEWGYILGSFVFAIFVLKTVPLACLGMWMYSQREIGLVVKK